MKIIRIKTDNTVDVFQYPDKKNCREELAALRMMIGDSCELAEHVRPKRLYEYLNGCLEPTKFKGEAVSMLVDEEGYYHDLPVNLIGSWLYQSDIHGNPIVGDVMIIGEFFDKGGDISFCGLSEYNFSRLYDHFQMLAEKARTYYAV